MPHELNQPLTAIAGYADACARMLVRDDCGKGDIADVLASIAEQAHRAGEIIRRLRAFVGKQAAHYLLLDINGLVHETGEKEPRQ